MDRRAVMDPYSALTSAWRSSTHSVTSWSSACAWCPQPPSPTRCSLTASPTHSTWRSSKPRFPVPRTFTPPCWTVPTRSRARHPPHLLALGAPCEVGGQGVGQAVFGGWCTKGMKSVLGLNTEASCLFLPEHRGGSQQGAAEANRELAGRSLPPCPFFLLPLLA
uniref:Macaca fascicularis brain cDNA clone: QflA-13237, similar to human homolog of Drosophila Intersex (Intersex), mRNA, RefSeq: XM_290829.3 n=1 Tax=Macaca fascicularis TaxID=9541 RepID=I7GHS8_MACFA|nr:unnamed protein product [Macaca fascicularis]